LSAVTVFLQFINGGSTMSDEKKKDKNEHVVIAIFPSQSAADSAMEGLKQWDGANDEVKLGAVGTISKEKGKLKTSVGRNTGKGAAVGATVGIIAGVLSGGLTLIGGALAGSLAGGGVGAVMKKSLHMTKEEIAALDPELDGGNVALVVTCDDYEVGPTQEWLAGAGGAVRGYTIPSEALQEAVDAGVGADVPVEATPEPMAEPVAEADAPPAESDAGPSVMGDEATSEEAPV
jgi:hypothetical protein